MGLRLSITSDGEIKRKITALLSYEAGFQAKVSEVVRVHAFDVVANAKDLVPISTGALRRSIRATFVAGGMAAVIGSFLPYAARQEFDAALDHRVRGPRRRIRNTKAGRPGTIIKGTQQTNPNATWGFLRKSLATVAPYFLSDLQKIVDGYGEAWEFGL